MKYKPCIYIYIYILAILSMRIFFQTPNPNSKKFAPKHRTIFRQALQEEAKEVHTALMMALLGSQWISAESSHRNLAHTPLKTNISPGKMMVGRCISYWNSPFLGGLVNFQGCRLATGRVPFTPSLFHGAFWCICIGLYTINPLKGYSST